MADSKDQTIGSPGTTGVPDTARKSNDNNIAIGRVDTGLVDETEKLELSAETYATILAKNKPNPLGSGYLRLYLLSAAVFLCSTMNGTVPTRPGGRLYCATRI